MKLVAVVKRKLVTFFFKVKKTKFTVSFEACGCLLTQNDFNSKKGKDCCFLLTALERLGKLSKKTVKKSRKKHSLLEGIATLT